MRRPLRDNGLSLVLFGLFAVSFVGQIAAGRAEYNDERAERAQPPVGYAAYLTTGAFVEATMENWESEFLQMAAYVLLTAYLFQRGSAESKDPDRTEEVDREPDAKRPDAPWPVRRGGMWLHFYEYSLSAALLALFVLSFVLHASGGAAAYNEELVASGSGPVTVAGYFTTSRFWFESLQNWQSEFFSIWTMIVLSIFLRQKGSPESKPVDSPHAQTGT